MITQELLKQEFDYNPLTGVVIHRTNKGRNKVKGKVAGSLTNHGYLQTSYKNKKLRLHRLVWIYMYGIIPDGYVIDHINQDRADNRIENLRLVTSRENSKNCKMSKNNTSGHTGVSWDKSKNAYIVTVGKKFIGRCKDIDDAIKLRESSVDKEYTKIHGKGN